MSSTGSVYQRKSDGRWVASIRLDGHKITRYAKTERQAKHKLRELIGQHEQHILTVPTRTTLAEWVERWLTSIEPDRRPSTSVTYRFALQPVIDLAGTTRLDRLTPDLLSRTIARMRQDNKGPRRVSQTYRVLHTCLRSAVRLGLISANPLSRVDAPRYEAEERPAWTLEEAKRFISFCATDGGHYVPMFLFMLGTGLRRGEATALTWDDIDRERGLVVVDKAVAFVRNKPVLQDTKTRVGRRVIALTKVARLGLSMLPGPNDLSDRLFVSQAGTPPTPSNVRTALHRLCKLAGVRCIPSHGLRHTHVSLMLAAGVDVLTVSRRIGHAKVSITLDVYGHIVRPDTHAANQFDQTIDDA